MQKITSHLWFDKEAVEAAEKIVDARPFRNKRDLLTRQLLSKDEYDKVKNAIVAKQPPKAKK